MGNLEVNTEQIPDVTVSESVKSWLSKKTNCFI